MRIGLGAAALALGIVATACSNGTSGGGTTTLTRTKPKTTHHAQSPTEFHRRKKSSIAVRHVSGDRIVASLQVPPWQVALWVPDRAIDKSAIAGLDLSALRGPAEAAAPRRVGNRNLQVCCLSAR